MKFSVKSLISNTTPLPAKSLEISPETARALRSIYQRYRAYYSNTEEKNLQCMVKKAVDLGEFSCSLFEEYALPEEGIEPEHLEMLFEKGFENQQSLRELIGHQLKDFSHFQKIRTVLARETSATPIVSVHYIIAWR